LTLSQTQCKSPYWKLNVRLLQEKDFFERFNFFWESWVSQKGEYENLIQWWELGKTQIKIFCQQFSSFSTIKTKQKISELEKEIAQITSNMVQQPDTVMAENLCEKRVSLKSLLQVQTKGALIRSRFLSVNDMDAPTAYFFNLEKVSKKQSVMHCLTSPDGSKTSDPKKMRKIAVDFYSDLFRADMCDSQSTLDLLENLPTIGGEQRASLDSIFSFQELTEAVQQMKPGRAPGIDGLPVEFYKVMWGIIGEDFYEVVQKCYEEQKLPKSCQRAVLALIPKKGDISLLKNWRPVSILTNDYKILAKVLVNRLKCVLSDIIHKDQSYCIPDRTIYDNIFLVRDLLDYCKLNEINLGLLSLDQEKAFDRVDHDYLFKTLKAFGCGDVFLSWIKILYKNASCLVKIGGDLSSPIRMQRGIRQGCPLSGQLYALAVEPLLCLLRKNVSGVCVGNSIYNTIKLTAYADDITVFVKTQADVNKIKNCLCLYEKASSAKLNWSKTEALWCNGHSTKVLPFISENEKWGKLGLKFLGIYLSNEEFQKKNMENVKDKVCAKLSKWCWLLSQLSYRGRVLVINNLVASTLWHRLNVLEPPMDFFVDIQRLLVNFFWSGRHWLKEAILYLPVQEGGQGLINLKSRYAAFRLKTVQRFLYHQDQNWMEVACALLKRVGCLGLDRHLFLMDLKKDLNGFTPFYASALQVWQFMSVGRVNVWDLEEPLFFNGLLSIEFLNAGTLHTNLIKAGICKIGHLKDGNQWITVEELHL